MADRAVRANSIVFDPPCLDFAPRIVEAQEPKCIQALLTNVTVEAFSESVVRRFARARVVEHDTMLPSPEIEITRDKFGPIVDPDSPRSTVLPCGASKVSTTSCPL